MTESTVVYPEKIWVGPNFQNLGIFILGESWYGDFSTELVTDDGYIRAYLEDRLVDRLYTRIANGVGMNKKLFWQSVMFTNYVQRVGPSRECRPTQDHYKAAATRLTRMLTEHSPRGVWILGKEQAQHSEPIVQAAGIPVEVVVHPSSYGVTHEILRTSWEALLAKVSNRLVSRGYQPLAQSDALRRAAEGQPSQPGPNAFTLQLARTQPPGCNSAHLSRSTSKIEQFSDDEVAYLQWVQSNARGYVVNLDKARSYPQYPMVHRASHKIISSPARTNYTTNEFIKICSTDLAALERWSQGECGRVLNRCATCM